MPYNAEIRSSSSSEKKTTAPKSFNMSRIVRMVKYKNGKFRNIVKSIKRCLPSFMQPQWGEGYRMRAKKGKRTPII